MEGKREDAGDGWKRIVSLMAGGSGRDDMNVEGSREWFCSYGD